VEGEGGGSTMGGRRIAEVDGYGAVGRGWWEWEKGRL